MSKEWIISLAGLVVSIIVMFTGLAYSQGKNEARTDEKIRNLEETLITSQDFAKQQEQVKSLVKTVDTLTVRMDKLIEIMLQKNIGG
jgi:uncharacterized protein YlxW (UPF0749 family)